MVDRKLGAYGSPVCARHGAPATARTSAPATDRVIVMRPSPICTRGGSARTDHASSQVIGPSPWWTLAVQSVVGIVRPVPASGASRIGSREAEAYKLDGQLGVTRKENDDFDGVARPGPRAKICPGGSLAP